MKNKPTLDAYRLSLKLYFEPSIELDQDALIPVFHRFIQERVLDELLIDVADYRHVEDGPGVMLIGHGANYSLDQSDGMLGLLYFRKRPQPGSFEERLGRDLERLLLAGRELLREFPGWSLGGSRWALRIHDRLLASNDQATLEAARALVEPLLRRLYPGDEASLEWEDDPRECFGLQIKASEAPGVEGLLERLTGPLPAGVELVSAGKKASGLPDVSPFP